MTYRDFSRDIEFAPIYGQRAEEEPVKITNEQRIEVFKEFRHFIELTHPGESWTTEGLVDLVNERIADFQPYRNGTIATLEIYVGSNAWVKEFAEWQDGRWYDASGQLFDDSRIARVHHVHFEPEE